MLSCVCPNCGKTLEVKDPSRESMFCEYCGAKIQIRVNINATYSYSEHKETSTHTEHIVDDAKIKNAENINRIIGVFASPFESFYAKKEKKRQEAEEEAARQREAQRKAEEESAAFRADMSRQMESLSRSIGRGIAALINISRQKPKQALLVVVTIAVLIGGGSAIASQKHQAALERASHIAQLNQMKEQEIAASHQALGEAFIPKNLSTTGDYRISYKSLRDAGFTNITLVPKGDLIIGYFETENDIVEITFDGSPKFDTGVWMKADVPIVISYHSFMGSTSEKLENAKVAASQKVDEIIDSATEKMQETADRIASPAQSSPSSTSPAASSKPEPSLDYTPSHSETNYDAAYCQRHPEYANYCLISYQDKIVRFFSYGNDSTESYVGHITGGSKSEGLTVHYNYDNGWDETIKIVGTQMILTDGNGFDYAFNLSPLSPVRGIYKDNNYHDIREK